MQMPQTPKLEEESQHHQQHTFQDQCKGSCLQEVCICPEITQYHLLWDLHSDKNLIDDYILETPSIPFQVYGSVGDEAPAMPFLYIIRAYKSCP